MMNELGRYYEQCECTDKTMTMRCRDCNTVYCADCHDTRIWVNTSLGKKNIRCCPKCVGTSLQPVTFDDSTPINIALEKVALDTI